MENITFESIKIGLASPDKIREWSHGEVTKPETINYRTLRPEWDGLFCEKIFGPLKDWECHCGKYKRSKNKGKICEKCGVEITKAKVRRERMGHIELATPVSHIWYFKGIPSRIGLMLDMSPKDLERVLYFSAYVVINPGSVTEVNKCDVIDDKRLEEIKEYNFDDTEFRVGMGAEAIKELLAEIDLDELDAELRQELGESKGQKSARILKRLEVVEAFKNSGNRPEWMILDVVPVIPPDIRPMVQLDGGRFATSDLNDLYRRVINRNNRLKKLIELGAPNIIIRNEKRMLQESVDALIDNGRRGRPVTGPNNRPLKSLSDMLKGKQGRFRQNLLGKRVDYSGRSVIVVGPNLKIYQCGLPKEMALELFKPFVMKRLIDISGDKNNGTQKTNIKTAKKAVERRDPEVWDALETVIKDHPVMLNRAPTLHRLGIQAFEPVLVEGKAIKLHPLVCTAFNADFDGDQMAVHVPLSAEAQAEARFLMLSSGNLLKPSDGKPVTVPTQDMVLGSYYLTLVMPGAKGEGKAFSDVNEAQMAYDEKIIDLHALIKVRMTKEIDGKPVSKIIETTLGKIIFNNPIPQDLGFIDRSDPENLFRLEVEGLVNKKLLGKIVDRCIRVHGTAKASAVLDDIKNQGYKFSTRSGITVAVCDATIPEAKKDILAEAEATVDEVNRKYSRGLLSNTDRSKRVIEAWDLCTSRVAEALTKNFDKFNPIYMMLDSGARGSESQLRQLAGMRGLIANTAGKTIEVPIRANYREGLNVQEYFISSRGARKGLADTALRTADSGYLTRRLVDVSQEVIIREEDCGCTEGLEVYDIMDGNRILEPLTERLRGRFLLHDLVDEETGEVIMSNDHMMSEDDANKVDAYLTKKSEAALAAGASKQEAEKLRRITIRSLLTCNSSHGACIKCYGSNLATGKPVTVGEAVGIIAAQSIGEPGTQLTMRTFHTGGVASGSDITQGLPRVEELFEARKPKTLAIISEIDGEVSIEKVKGNDHIVVTSDTGERKEYLLAFGARRRVEAGAHVKKGDLLTEGSTDLRDILNVLGVSAVHDYLISQVQCTYRTQGVDINDKHIEVIARQMMRKVKIEDAGDTDFLPGSLVDKMEFAKVNNELKAKAQELGTELQPATSSPVLMGITKASLATDSFLSAASFQETTRVLTDAAIKGKVDPLLGLKENVIIGKLLPSGTGMKCYSDVEYKKTAEDSEESYMEV
ncbi:MAG: DNA-directed RNA polymerase subunit beta' [Acutalibacteraceae bacterium]